MLDNSKHIAIPAFYNFVFCCEKPTCPVLYLGISPKGKITQVGNNFSIAHHAAKSVSNAYPNFDIAAVSKKAYFAFYLSILSQEENKVGGRKTFLQLKRLLSHWRIPIDNVDILLRIKKHLLCFRLESIPSKKQSSRKAI